MHKIRFDRAIAAAMQQKPGAANAAAAQAPARAGGGTALVATLRRLMRSPAQTARKALSAGKQVARRVLRPWLHRVRWALNGPQDIALAGIHAKQDAILPKLETLGAVCAELDVKLTAMRARIDDISIKVRGPIELDADTLAIRTADGYAAVPRSDATLNIMLTDSDVGGLEPGTRLVLRRLLAPGATFVDVGAHIGLMTLIGARCVGAKGRVHAFEASPRTFALLERTVAINGLSGIVAPRRMAVGSREEERSFFVRNILGHSSLYDFRESDEGFTTEEVAVTVRPLDALLHEGERVDVVKIDVEGAELDVLAGMKGLLARNPEVALLTEFGPSHLARIGVAPEAWFGAFEAEGLTGFAIDEESGACRPVKASDVAEVDSVNIAFVAPYSKAAGILS